MPNKSYLSNILKVWTLEAQRELLDTVGEKLIEYRDELKPGQRKRKDVEALFWRSKMLAATGRRTPGETIYFACWGMLAWNLMDLGRCFAAAKSRGATLVALNTGLRIGPDAGAVEIAQAQKDFTLDKRRGAVQPGRSGYEITAELKKADTLRRINLIRQDWGNPEFTQAELLLRAGRRTKRGHLQPMAWKTAREHLNTRRWAIAHRAGMQRSKVKKGESVHE